MAVSVIGGGNRSIWRKLLTCRKLHKVVLSTHRHERIWTRNFNGDRYWLHRKSCISNTITTTTALLLN